MEVASEIASSVVRYQATRPIPCLITDSISTDLPAGPPSVYNILNEVPNGLNLN